MTVKKIVFTGGGTAGHVTPNLAIISALEPEGWKMHYIGSATGIEKTMIESLGIPFHAIQSGKLRRYFSLKNFLDPFKIVLGIIQSFFLFRNIKPQVVFSKGGFVAFPVVVGAWLNRIPVIAHESDISPGLANTLSFPFVTTICLTFDAAKSHFKNQEKTIVTGTPIREQLFLGSKKKGLALCGFNEEKPCLLIIGGSLGAGSINKNVRLALESLTKNYQIIHICGKGKSDHTLNDKPGYCQFEYVNEALADLFACAHFVISRSGANSLYELLALGKPHILIPLSAKVSRGDQVQNARYMQKLGISIVIQDDLLTPETLLSALDEMVVHQNDIKQKIETLNIQSATKQIVTIIKERAGV